MGFENYLVLVTPTVARLYLHSGMYYQAVQNLTPGHGLSYFHAFIPLSIPSWRGKSVLLTGVGTRLVAYVWNGATQKVHVTYETDLPVAIKDWNTGFGHAESNLKHGSNFVFISGETGSLTLEVKAKLEDLPDPVTLQNQALQVVIDALEEEYLRQQNVIELAQNRLDFSIEGQNTIIGNIVIVNGIKVNGTLDTEVLDAQNILLEQVDPAGEVTHQSYQEHISSLGYYDGVLDTLNSTLRSLHLRLDDAVPSSGSTRLITGVKSVVEGGLDITTLTTTHLTVRQPLDVFGNPFPLDDILGGIIRRNDTRVIAGRKTFLKPLEVVDLYPEYLDDIPVSDIVTTSGSQTIAGAAFASGLVADTISVTPGGTVAGIDLSEEAVLLYEDATLGNCVFKDDLYVNEMTAVSGLVDGVNIEYLQTNALTTHGGTILGSLVFTNSLKIHTLEAKSIMGVNTAHFMSTTVFRNQPAVMSGSLVVPSVDIKEDLFVEGTINGNRFPQDYPLQTDTTINFGAKKFANVYFGSVAVGPNFLVDGLPLDKLVTLHTPQVITGGKVFAQGVFIEGDLDVTSKLIDGVNLDELNASLSYMNTSDWKFDVIFEKDVHAPSIAFGGKLNGLDWNYLANDIVYDDETSVTISSVKTFKAGLTITDAIFKNTFNGESFSNLVTTSSDEIITGEKAFLNDVTFGSLTVDLLAGIDLETLVESAVYLNRDGQVVRGKKTFTNTLATKVLDITENIRNVDFHNVVTKSTDQVFTAPQSLRFAAFNDLEVKSIDMIPGATVNTVDISLLNSKHVSLTSNSYHSGVLTVEGPVVVEGPLSVGTINGYDLYFLTQNLVLNDESSVITGDVTFLAMTVNGPITTSNSVGANGLNISDIDYHAVKLAGNTEMTGGATWGDLFFNGDVEVGGLVNGIDLRKLNEDIVYKDSNNIQIITGKKTFEAGLTVQGDIEALTVNGIDLRKSLLTRHTDQTISAPYTFVDVETKGFVEIRGLFNEVNLTRLTSQGLLGAGETIYGNVTFFGEVSTDHLRLQGSFNGINTKRRMAQAVRIQDTDVIISGKKNFLSNMTTFRNLNVRSLNNIPFNNYLQHVVLRDSNSNLTGSIVVEGVVTSPQVTAQSITVKDKIDGVDYNRLLRDAVFLNKNQTIESNLVFTKDLNVLGDIQTLHLNGLNLETDFLTTNTAQTITSTVTFGNITTTDVQVDGLVNSWYLPDEVAVTMKAVSGQTVTGSFTLEDPAEVLGNVELTGYVGTDVKIDLSEQAINLKQRAEIQGSVIFHAPVSTSTLTSSTGIVNGIDVPDLYYNAWFLDKPTDISGFMVFEGPVLLFEALLKNSSMEPLKISDLRSNLTKAIDDYQVIKADLRERFPLTCSPIAKLHKILRTAIYEGDYFKSVYEDISPYQRHSSTTFFAFNTTYVVITWKGLCDSVLYSISQTSPILTEVLTISGSGFGHQWIFLGATYEEVYLAMAASTTNNTCRRRNSVIWKLTKTSIYVHKELVPGESLSQVTRAGLVYLYVHDLDHTIAYIFDLLTGDLQEGTGIGGHVDLSSTLLTRSGVSVEFRSSRGQGTLIVNGQVGAVIEVAKRIDDVLLMEQGDKVFLLLSVTRLKMHKELYVLELYSVDLRKKVITWSDIHFLPTRIKVVAFFAGVRTTGSCIVIALQENRMPVVYTLLGETLKEIAHLSTPRVDWAQHIPLPKTNISDELSDHYLLLGQNDGTTILTQLVMKGAALPEKNITCQLDYFV
ncbi:uncharacterized protein [Panulirus ornatus]|uniref:uncharacterized protein n=1 Tax=Panulirus ornatus TaxID=150431 RepID=UPI003A851CF2